MHPARCTLHVAPCTLHPARCTLHVAPCTLHPARCIIPTSMRPLSFVLVIAALVPVAAGGAQQPSSGPMVTVIGPVAPTTPLRDPAHGYPFNATPMDLAKQGYIEEEFFIQGTASR